MCHAKINHNKHDKFISELGPAPPFRWSIKKKSNGPIHQQSKKKLSPIHNTPAARKGASHTGSQNSVFWRPAQNVSRSTNCTKPPFHAVWQFYFAWLFSPCPRKNRDHSGRKLPSGIGKKEQLNNNDNQQTERKSGVRAKKPLLPALPNTVSGFRFPS